MKKLFMSIFVCLSLLFIIFYVESSSVSTKQEIKNNGRYIPNEVVVKFKTNVNKDIIRAVIGSIQGKIFTYLKDEISISAWEPGEVSLRSFRLDPCLLHIKVPESIGTEKAIELLSKDPNIEFAEKNSIGYLSETEPENDERFDEQWALRNDYGSDIDATYAWDISTGNSNIVVAVIDTGVDYDHDDLEGNMWINEDEIPGNENDDDNNGYIDDVYGYDFKNNDNDPNDIDGHGTHVAGIIGAIANNEIGIVGVNWTVKIMALKMSNDGSFCTTDAIHAIDYSTANGAHLSNNSWAIGDEYNHALFQAIGRARNCEYGSGGKLFITVAGNYSKYDWYNNDQRPIYPASYPYDNIISVCSTDINNDLDYDSHYGQTSVDIGAPGRNILSTYLLGTWREKSGTSTAAPHVAGVAALLWSKCPLLKWQTAKKRIMENNDHLSSLENKTVTEARLNAYKAIYDSSPPSAAPSSLNAWPTGWSQINLCWQDNSNNEAGFELQRKKAGEGDYSTLGSQRDNLASYYDKTATAGVVHYYKVRAFNFAGNSSFSNIINTTIPATTPATPTGLWARSPSPPDGVQLSWYDSSNNELNFIIERKSFSFPIWEEIGGTMQNVSWYFDENLQPGETYWYRVRAWNPIGYSSYSNEIQVVIWDY